MTSINGFCNEEFELEKEFCQKKVHVSVIKTDDSEDGHNIIENTLKTKFEIFWQKA